MTQSALIVGASRGLGLGLVAEYLSRGWSVIATVRDGSGDAALKVLPGAERLTIHHADVTSDPDIARLADAAEGPIDVLFVNAGIMGPPDMASASAAEIDRVMQTNAFGPARLAWALIDKVREQTGVLALMSTGMGSIADNTSGGYDAYRASKAAQNMLARSLWVGPGRERGVTVLSVNPGWVRTEMGGPGGTIDVETSCRGMADQIAANAGAHEHRFIGWNGRDLPLVKSFQFDAQVTSAHFEASGAVFALGDGSVRFEDGTFDAVHDGAILCAVVHPGGEGLVTGGDDGRVIWSRKGEAGVLATGKGWIDAVAASAASNLIAFSSGRTVSVIDATDAGFRRDFQHERTVSGVAFDAKGRRIAASTYGGAWLWYARIADQKPVRLNWAGSHTGVAFSPDGAFVVTTMQDDQLHAWRLKDAKDLRMGGYPGKVRSIAFLSKGQLMATSGAQGAVLWPFVGANGPMGREASEIGFDDTTLVHRVAAAPAHGRLAAGLGDGRVWVADPAAQGLDFVKAEKGPPITALALDAAARRLAWADEDGRAGVVDLD